MKKITDEMLNDYLDNQLDSNSLNELKESIDNDPESLNRLKTLKLVDESLRDLEVYEAPLNFSDRMMKVIYEHSKSFKPKINLFFAGIVSVFGIIILSVFVTALVIVVKANPSIGNFTMLDSSKKFLNENVNSLGGLLNNHQVLFAGGVLGVILLLSALIIIDSHKNFKNKLKSVSH